MPREEVVVLQARAEVLVYLEEVEFPLEAVYWEVAHPWMQKATLDPMAVVSGRGPSRVQALMKLEMFK